MQLIVTKTNTLQAFTWIKQGWRLFTQQPGPFMGMTAIIMVISILAQLIPIFSFLAVFMMPFLTAGYYQAASRVEQGEKITASAVFYYLSQIASHRVFLRLAGISVLLSIPMSITLVDAMEQMQQGYPPSFLQVIVVVVTMAINFMLMAFSVPAAWVSPNTPALTLVKQSFYACWINVLPLTLYGILMFLIGVISFPIILIGWLIAMSLGSLSFYQMFMDVYQPANSEYLDDTPVADQQRGSEQQDDVQQDSNDRADH